MIKYVIPRVLLPDPPPSAHAVQMQQPGVVGWFKTHLNPDRWMDNLLPAQQPQTTATSPIAAAQAEVSRQPAPASHIGRFG